MSEWIWMPHAAHLCVSSKCHFRLATYVNGVIVSTVGEYDRDDTGVWGTIGLNRKYETMVFKAQPSTPEECNACQYRVAGYSEIDFEPYNTAKDAYEGHLAMCRKWDK